MIFRVTLHPGPNGDKAAHKLTRLVATKWSIKEQSPEALLIEATIAVAYKHLTASRAIVILRGGDGQLPRIEDA